MPRTLLGDGDALLLVFRRLGGGDAEELPFDVSADIKLREGADDSEVQRPLARLGVIFLV